MGINSAAGGTESRDRLAGRPTKLPSSTCSHHTNKGVERFSKRKRIFPLAVGGKKMFGNAGLVMTRKVVFVTCLVVGQETQKVGGKGAGRRVSRHRI